MNNLLQDLRYWRADAAEETGLHVDRHCHAWRWALAQTRRSSASSMPCCCGHCLTLSRNGWWLSGKPTRRIRRVEVQSLIRISSTGVRRANPSSGWRSYYTNNSTLTGVATPVNLHCAVVSAELFALLGARPQQGRLFLPEEDKPGNSTGRAAIISHSLWQQQFSADSNILGRSVTLSGKVFNVVGVMPAGFQYPIEAEPVEFWITSTIDGEKTDPKDKANNEQRGAHYLQVVGRLKPNVKLEQAQAELDVIAANLEKQYPDTNTRTGVRVISYHNDLVSDYKSALWIILGAVGCVLLIACANVANLLLARATARYKEMALRSALGANRWRIIRQLLTESLVLSLAGGVLGLLLAWWGMEVLIKMIPEDVPRLTEISIDRWVFGFTLLVSAVTGIIFGLIPALQASKVELTEAMKEGGRASGSGGGRSRLRNALVVAEIAVAIVVLVSAGLLLKSFRKLQQVDLGYDMRNVLTASVEIPDTQYPKQEQVAAFYKALMEKLKALPGVEQGERHHAAAAERRLIFNFLRGRRPEHSQRRTAGREFSRHQRRLLLCNEDSVAGRARFHSA